MTRNTPGSARLGILLVAFAIAFSPFASATWAQTPIADETPTVIVETETPVSTDTPVATETEAPVQPENPVVPTTPTETPQETATPPVVTGPDLLTLETGAVLDISAGEHRDITVRYTMGSDRDITSLDATLTSHAGDSLVGWTISPMDRVDLADDPADPGRDATARVDVSNPTENASVVILTFRVTAPAHIEFPASLNVDVASTITAGGGSSSGVDAQNLVAIQAAATTHAPTLACTAGAANTWTCSYTTTHPGSIAMNASAAVPNGWQLMLDGAALSADAVALTTDASGAGSFGLQATYPIGCPDVSSATATLSVAFSYPSGDVHTLVTDLPFDFDRPSPTLTVTDLAFGDIQSMDDLTSTGSMTVSYANVPCAWQASFELSDLASDSYTVTDGLLSLVGIEGLPGASAALDGNTLTLNVPEATGQVTEGEFTINLTLTLPHIIPPGSYVIGVITQLGWLDD